MQKSYPEVRAVIAKLITDKPVKKTPYQVKGVFMKQYPDEEIVPMLDGRYRERFLYPRVQVKILNEQIYVVGIGEGVEPVLELAKQFNFLDFGNITFQVLDVDLEESNNRFRPINRLIRYRFITPWVALNQTTGSRYRFLNNAERVIFLNRLLGQNIVFLAREMGLDLEERVYTKTSLTSLFPRPVDENNWGAFYGEFRTNFILPNYLGIGNGITRGYGTIYGLFNPDMFHFDENALQSDAPKADAEEISEDDFELESVRVEEVPKPRKRSPRKPSSTKRVLSEEFEVEEGTQPPFSAPKPKRKSGKSEPLEDEEIDDKFNREEYHRKQHNI
ncbi:MAG: CRISPR-associated endonuclease Cas6 [FCB group bacterium]|nr:CRISPR-associated endonuclease Cas6 [FCB group bacterium]